MYFATGPDCHSLPSSTRPPSFYICMKRIHVAVGVLYVLQIQGFLCFSHRARNSFSPSRHASESIRHVDASQEETRVDEILPSVPSKNDEWLLKSTVDILNQPLGSFRQDEVDSISGLIAAWARRREPVRVEQLLKRIVDDMKAGNGAIRVSSRLYVHAIDAHGKAGDAHRAQEIHDAMRKMYQETNEPTFAPSAISYNALLNAWAKSGDDSATDMVRLILEEMLQSNQPNIQPDTITFCTVMDAFARSKLKNATEYCEDIFRLMGTYKSCARNVYAYSSLQNVYARSGRPDALLRTQEILYEMIDRYDEGDVLAKPNILNFNAILNAASRTHTQKGAEMAVQLLERMELPLSEGGYDVEPDRLSYAMTILACARSPNARYAATAAERTLERMEIRAEIEEKRKREISQVAPALVTLDVECFNVVLTAIAREEVGRPERALRIIDRMETYAHAGQDHVRPNIRSWNHALNAFARSATPDDVSRALRCEEILERMLTLYQSGNSAAQPDAFSFAAVLSAFQRSSSPSDSVAAERADALVRSMELLFTNGTIQYPPDVYHYTILCGAWAKSDQKGAPARCLQILCHMMEREKQGFRNVRPNSRTYNAVIDCLARAADGERAEELLYYMLALHRKGDASPDAFSFNSCIRAHCRSGAPDAGRRAEFVLERFMEYNEFENPSVRPDLKTFAPILQYYSQSEEIDSIYRAEYILNRMLGLYDNGFTELAPETYMFLQVIKKYAFTKHPDAGRNAERLLKNMVRLSHEESTDIRIDRFVMNGVLMAWASCGDATRAEHHLKAMEKSTNERMRPDQRSYGLVLSAMAKSDMTDKDICALNLLRRMQIPPDAHAFSLVINACAFTSGSFEVEARAFDTSVMMLNEILESDDLTPSALTFGWFLQACGRLNAPDDRKSSQIRRAFSICTSTGLLSNFVLNRLKGATSDALFMELVGSPKGAVPSVHKLPQAWRAAVRNN